MEPHIAETLATLRDTLRITREVRDTELQAGNHAMVAAEDEMITRLEARIARLEALARRHAAPEQTSEPPGDSPGGRY